MKKSKSYFGNRFKSAVRGFRAQRNAKKELAAASLITSSEFEVLEPRVLLSGVGKAVTSKQWTDADGDKVVAKIVGKGAQIQVDVGDGKGLDAANINIVGADYGALSVVVTPVGKMTTPVQTKAFYNPTFPIDFSKTSTLTDLSISVGKGDKLGLLLQNQWYNLTPGYTNIGSITAEASFDPALGYTAPAAISSINLSGVVVPVIDLGNAEVGNINVSTGRVQMVDALMSTNDNNTPGYLAWNPNIGQIDVYDITAGSIDQINLAGQIKGNNDFVGTIKLTDGGLNRLTGTQSEFQGSLIFEGKTAALGNVVLGPNGFTAASSITALGDLTFQAKKFDGILDVGGHLNVSITDGFTGTIMAGKGVSGLRAATDDAIMVNQGNFTGQLVVTGNIADMVFNNSKLVKGTIEATGNIGTIRLDGVEADGITALTSTGSILATGDIEGIVIRNNTLTLGGGALLVSAAKVGSIDVANGALAGALAVGEIGDVLVRGGDLTAKLVSTGDGGIGSVTVELGSLTGALFAQGGNIGDVTVLADNNGGAAISGSIISEAGSIGAIDATNVGGGQAIGGATIFAKDAITSIDASTTGGTAIGPSTITAEGSLGPINAIAYGAGGTGTIAGLSLVAPTIGNITATSLQGAGIVNSTFTSTTGGIGSISGTGSTGGLLGVIANSAAGIGTITGKATQTGDGIGPSTTTDGGVGPRNSQFIAQNGDIDEVTGTTTSTLAGDNGLDSVTISASGDIGKVSGTAFAGDGIFQGAITSLKGDVNDVTGLSNSPGADNGDGIAFLTITSLAGKVGNVTGTSNGSTNTSDGLDTVTVNALTGIGTIKGVAAQAGDGIFAGTYTVTGPTGNIDAVIGETNSGRGIAGNATFSAVGGEIKAITATPTGAGGSAVNGASFTASKLGDLTFQVTNLDGSFAVNNLTANALSGDIGNILVTNASLRQDAYGINNSNITADKGNIGNITVTTAGGKNVTGSFGIGASNFKAAGNIGKIDVRTTGNGSNGIQGSTFTADTDGSGAGDITSIYVKTEGVGSNGIINSGATNSVFTAQNITGTGFGGKSIEVQIANISLTTAADGIKANAINDVVLNVAKNVGDLTVANSGQNANSDGLENVKLTIGGTLGAVNITTVGGVAMRNATIDPTTIASVTLKSVDPTTTATDNAMINSKIIASVSIIGNTTIEGNVDGFSAIWAKKTTGDNTATSLGKIDITGNFAGAIEAGTTIGAITINGDALAGSTIKSGQAKDATAGLITSITVNTTSATGVTGKMATAVTAAVGNIGKVVVAGDFSGNITATKGDVSKTDGLSFGTVTAGSITAGSAAAPNNNAGDIGNITIVGDSAATQSLVVNAFKGATTGGTVGTIKAEGIKDNADILQINLGANTVSVGAITVSDSDTGENANLELSGGASLTTLGAITVDGSFKLSNNLAAVTSAGAFNVGSVVAPGALIQIGSGATGAGSTIASIAIGADTAGAGANQYSFRFGTIAGQTTASAGANVVATVGPTNAAVFNVTNTKAAGGQSSTGGAINVQLL